jgi:hypothetical protein
MTRDEELKKLHEEEKMLLSQLNGLRQKANEQKEVPEKQNEQKEIEGLIAHRESMLKEVRNEIKSLEGNELENDRVRKLTTKEAAAAVFEMSRAVLGMAEDNVKFQQELAGMIQQKPPAIEIVVENPSPGNKSLEQVVADQWKDINKELEGLKDEVKREDRVKDEAKEWEKSIAEKEAPLQKERERQLQNLETNIVWQESYLNERKKDGYEQKLEQLKVEQKERSQAIEENFKKQMEPIEKEKDALKLAIESTKDMTWEDRNREIERQRKEFERQLELEKEKQKQQEKVL